MIIIYILLFIGYVIAFKMIYKTIQTAKTERIVISEYEKKRAEKDRQKQFYISYRKELLNQYSEIEQRQRYIYNEKDKQKIKAELLRLDKKIFDIDTKLYKLNE